MPLNFGRRNIDTELLYCNICLSISIYLFFIVFSYIIIIIAFYNIFLLQLLCVDPKIRISSLKDLREKPLMSDVDFDSVLQRNVKPSFIPAVSVD